MVIRFIQAALIVLLAVAPAIVKAQVSSGQVLGQVQKSITPSQLPSVRAPTIAPQIIQTFATNGPKMLLKGVRFSGNTAVGSDELLSGVREFVGVRVGINDLLLISDILVQRYTQAGFLANVTLPAQDVTSGVVLFEITEARLGDVIFSDDQIDKVRVERETVTETIDVANPKQQLVVLDKIDRAILLLDDLKGVSVSGGLQAGKNEKETDLLLEVQPEPVFSGSINFDNFGSSNTGERRLILSTSYASPLNIGDQFNVIALGTEGVKYGSLGYRAPVGYSGLIASVQVGRMEYETKSINTHGSSSSFDGKLQYPMTRSFSANHYLTAEIERKTFNAWVWMTDEDGQSGGYDQSEKYDLSAVTIGLTGNKSMANGEIAYSLSLKHGYVDDSGNNANQAFSKLSASGNLRLPVQQNLNFNLNVEAQLATNSLKPSDSIYLGGFNGVRAYEEGKGGGSEGIRLAIELDSQLTDGVVGTLFFDGGRVVDNTRKTDLKGVGIMLNFTSPDGLQVRTIFSNPVEYETSESATPQARFGISISKVF